MDDDRVRIRIHFLSKHDMFFGQVAGDASKLLESWSLEGAPAPRGVNDAVELWECHRIFREIEPGTARDEGWYELFGDRARDAAGAAMKFLSQALAGDGFEAAVDHLDHSLVDGLLDALGSGGLAKKGLISADSFEVALCSRPWLIGLALEQQPLVKLFGEPVRRAMLANKEDSSELILNAVATSHVGVSSLALPKELTSDDVESILDAYCDCERAHINKLEVIANWKSYGGYSLSGPLRHKAKLKAQDQGKLICDSPGSVTSDYGVGICFDPDQKACKKVDFDGPNVLYSFSLSWLESYVDEATVLTNLIHVFELIDTAGLLNIGKPDRSMSTLERALLIRGKDDFVAGRSFKIREMTLIGFVNAYEALLLAQGTSLEAAIDWFFNSYIDEEFGAKGFRCDMPSPDSSYLSRCETVSSQMERIVKEYHLFARDGSLDAGLFSYESFPNFESIATLCGDKYAYGRGKDFERFTFLLFSDQCMLAYLSDRKCKAGSFDQLMRENRLSLADYDGHHWRDDLDWLLAKGFVRVDGNGFLALSNMGHLGRLIWENGALPLSACSPEIRQDISDGVKADWIELGSTLLSRSEADVFNYVLTDRYFGNSLGIRNKYAHGAPPAEDPSAEEFKRDYIHLLSFMLLLVLKINDELVEHYKRVGQLEFIDWPLCEVGKGTIKLCCEAADKAKLGMNASEKTED